MIRRLLVLATLGVIGYFVLTLVTQLGGAREAERGISDPAIVFHARSHSSTFAAIDRWAYYGMPGKQASALLSDAGYACRVQTGLPDERGGYDVASTVCEKAMQAPLPRILRVTLTIDDGWRSRLIAAEASTLLTGWGAGLGKVLAPGMRALGWLEPSSERIGGFSPDSIDLLGRFVIDALSPNGWRQCADFVEVAECVRMASDRRENGWPMLPAAGASVVKATRLYAAMEQAHLYPVVSPDAHTREGRELSVRVDGTRMWMDFAGKDLKARQISASIELAASGGTPTRLVLQLGSERREFPLQGEADAVNDGAHRFLAPLRGVAPERSSVWLQLSNQANAPALARLKIDVPEVDPAFVPGVLKAFTTEHASVVLPEEQLGLYPALRGAEKRAAAFRAAATSTWLPPEEGVRIMRELHAANPSIRAAWVMALCESAGSEPAMDGACWERFAMSDPGLAAFITAAVSELEPAYASLPATHILNRRLDRLRASGASQLVPRGSF